MAVVRVLDQPTAEWVDRLVDLAQTGHPEEALAEARELVAHGGDHRAATDYATAGIDVAVRDGRDGWRAVCLAMRALQLMSDGTSSPDSYDEIRVMRDLAQAQVALLAGAESTSERIGAYCNLATAYTRLRLYELAVPMYLEAATPVEGNDLPPEAAVVQQLNLATLHLTWTLELHHVGLVDEAGRHAAQALDHCLEAEHAAAGPHARTWAGRARVFAGCGVDRPASRARWWSPAASPRRTGAGRPPGPSAEPGRGTRE